MTRRRSDELPRDLSALPKAELHVHLEGAMRPGTLTELCLKHGLPRPADTRGRRFPDFSAFVATYVAACECLRDEEDLFRLVREVAQDVGSSGGIWAEVALSCPYYAERFGGTKATLKLLLRAAEAAEEAVGVAIGFIVAAERHLPASDAEELARVVRELVDAGDAMVNGRPGIVGFGLHADERGHPPEPFEEAFKVACKPGGGLAALPHAGELPVSPGGGPDSVRFCVEKLGARRIGHGVLAVEDDALVQSLAARGVCLDVCPSSNFLLSVVESLQEHPLPKLLSAGVPCTVNSDDPLLFGSSLAEEYEVCHREMGLSFEALAGCARNSIRYSCAPEAIKQKGLRAIDQWLAS